MTVSLWLQHAGFIIKQVLLGTNESGFSFVDEIAKLRKATISFIMSVCVSVRPSAWNNSASTGGILMKFDIWIFFFQKLSRKYRFYENKTRIRGTVREDQYTYFITSPSFLLRMRNVSDKLYRENRKKYFVLNNFFIFLKSCLLWDNVEKYCPAEQATDDNMAHAHFTPPPPPLITRHRTTTLKNKSSIYFHSN